MLRINIITLALFAVISFGFSSSNIIKSTVALETSSLATDTLTWKLLGDIKFVKKQHADYGEVMFPVVNAKLKGLQKKKVTISGFIVPIDNTNYAISKNVFASCFFCGQAGPETIMGIKFKDFKGRLKTDQYVTITGILRVNENNVDEWIYNLDQAVIVKGN
ncbi:MAG TPA: hypothetical protein VFQ50_11505 [Flavobacterium sp.]|jgi:hypothetical protein|nr:hypothetical protein [Flavobacterium sp.]